MYQTIQTIFTANQNNMQMMMERYDSHIQNTMMANMQNFAKTMPIPSRNQNFTSEVEEGVGKKDD